MTSASPTPPSLPLQFVAFLFPKPFSRSVKSLFLRPHLLLLSAFSVCLVGLTAVILFSQSADNGFSPQLPRHQHDSEYTTSLINTCRHVTSGDAGRTFAARVEGVGASFVSWTTNSSLDYSALTLDTHEAVRIMSKFPRPATLLDVGANIGMVTMPVLAMSQMHSVVAVEPVAKNIDVLCMTAHLNGWLGNAGFQLVKSALSDRTRSVEIFVPPARKDNAALSSEPFTKDADVGMEVDLVHILAGDDILAFNGLKPDVIRIDTHGHELYVIRGLKEYLRGAPSGAVVARERISRTVTRS